MWWACPVDVDFLEVNSLKGTNSVRYIAIDDEDHAARLLEKMSPICGSCLLEYLRANPKMDDLAKFFDELNRLKVPG
jgi:hypothetical protein